MNAAVSIVLLAAVLGVGQGAGLVEHNDAGGAQPTPSSP